VDIVDIQVSFATCRASATTWRDQMTIHKSAGSSRGFAVGSAGAKLLFST
jgi:hypothetical protein